MKRKCRFRDCDRPAMRGWTMCARHGSAGDSIRNDKRKKAVRQQARDMAAAHAEGLHVDHPREGCPECEGRELREYPEVPKEKE